MYYLTIFIHCLRIIECLRITETEYYFSLGSQSPSFFFSHLASDSTLHIEQAQFEFASSHFSVAFNWVFTNLSSAVTFFFYTT